MTSSSCSFNTKKRQQLAISTLIKITDILDRHNVPYFLEGGTLLGIVRDKAILPWDHDIDLSITEESINMVLKLRWVFFRHGFNLSLRRSKTEAVPCNKNDITIIKIKPSFSYLLSIIFSPRYINSVICDIFVKKKHSGFYYWQAMDKVMRVSENYFNSYTFVSFYNRNLKVPSNYINYLAEKYGDWTVSVKEMELRERRKNNLEASKTVNIIC